MNTKNNLIKEKNKRSAKGILKKNKIYFILFLLILIIMLYSMCNELYIIPSITKFISNSTYYTETFCSVTDIQPCSVNNLWDLLEYDMRTIPHTFDPLIIWSTSSFQILIPLFSSVIGVKIYYWYNSIFKLQAYRTNSYYKEFFGKVTSESLKFSISAFFAYLILFSLCILIAGDSVADYLTRDMFLDWFSDDFYINYRFFYFFMEGFARFFFVPFVYSFFAGGIAIVAKSLKQSIFIPLVYYFGLTLTISALSSFIGSNYFYFIPSTIMASSSYPNINTLMLFPVHIVPIIITILIIRYQVKLHEI